LVVFVYEDGLLAVGVVEGFIEGTGSAGEESAEEEEVMAMALSDEDFEGVEDGAWDLNGIGCGQDWAPA
jgi:hypothetical protein